MSFPHGIPKSLEASVPMGRVSVLLGHSSIKVTEKYYSPWVAARQEQLDADVRRTWDTLAVTKGRPFAAPRQRGSRAEGTKVLVKLPVSSARPVWRTRRMRALGSTPLKQSLCHNLLEGWTK